MYTANLIDHFTNPRNAGIIPDADGIGTIGDPDCGDFKKKEIRCSWCFSMPGMVLPCCLRQPFLREKQQAQ